MIPSILLRLFFLIIYIQNFANGNPLSGENVRKARDNEFPFIVSLSYKSSDNITNPEIHHFCGGALITRKHVLTAAHCFKKVKSPDDFVIKVNNRDLAKATIYEVKRWITYDQWAKIFIPNNTFIDIAVIELNSNVSQDIKLAVLAKIPETKLYGKKAVTAGWGFTVNNIIPRFLLTAELMILRHNECFRNHHPDTIRLIKNIRLVLMCTDTNLSVNLQCGDSGSPLLVNRNQIIAVNKGFCHAVSNDAILQTQNEHVPVNYYKKFIMDIIKCSHESCCNIQ